MDSPSLITSTPRNAKLVTARRGIRYPLKEGALGMSPIELSMKKGQGREELEQEELAISNDESDTEEDTNDDTDVDTEIFPQRRNYEGDRGDDNDAHKSLADKLMITICCGGVAILIIAFLSLRMSISTQKETSLNKLKDIRDEYHSQSDDLWIYINSSIHEVDTYNKPSVLLFVHEENGKDTVERMLRNVSNYANCVISDCNIPPITLTHKDLSRHTFLRDYGEVISQYKSELETKHVMIVKNLDLVPSEVAQAFHTFCDEITPLVDRSLFIFTISVYSFEGKDMEQVTQILHSKWQNLGTDKLEPLITRVTSVVQRIRSEQV